MNRLLYSVVTQLKRADLTYDRTLDSKAFYTGCKPFMRLFSTFLLNFQIHRKYSFPYPYSFCAMP